MNKAKAMRLLEMLRRRTEGRGATAAEAAQAAGLAEKLIKRFGLDEIEGDPEQSFEYETAGKTFPQWGCILAMGLERRFKCKGVYIRQVGKLARVRFTGPEHRARVAAWMFAAVSFDLRRDANSHARANGMAGPQLVEFRNRFLLSASLRVLARLNPLPPAERIGHDNNGDDSTAAATCRPRKQKRLTIAEAAKQSRLVTASVLGREAGARVKLSDQVIGDQTAKPSATLTAPAALIEVQR